MGVCSRMKLKCECGAQIWPKDMEEIKMYSMLDCPKHGTHNFNIYQGNFVVILVMIYWILFVIIIGLKFLICTPGVVYVKSALNNLILKIRRYFYD